MKDFKITLQRILKRAGESFHNFPASIFSAMVVAIVAFIRIEMDYEVEQAYNFLFNSIQFAFVFGAVSSMVIVGLKQIGKLEFSKSIINLLGLGLGLIAFVFLYFFGGNLNEQGFRYLTDISSARISVAIFISIVIFIYTISDKEGINSFPNAFFITHKAFVISIIYGLVLMIGVSGVLGAFQTLVYRDMTYKVYQYVGVIVGFLTYSIFLGYFPIFDTKIIERDINEDLQPRFIIVLFDYILIPIIIALTLVLFSWSARVLIEGIDVSFNQLSGIATSYVLVGIWLHIMVSDHEIGIAKFYKRAYPFSAILILLFQAWALISQLNKSGLQTTEYFFILLWIFAAISVILLVLNIKMPYKKIALLASVISFIAVLPLIGYHKLPLKMQISRLEKILVQEEFLVDNKIIKSDKEIEKIQKINITDAVEFISYTREGEKPIWFKDDLNSDKIFEDTFGFKKLYIIEDYPTGSEYYSSNLTIATQTIDISDYELSINIGFNERDKTVTLFEHKNKTYELTWDSVDRGIPTISIKSEDKVIIKEDLERFLDNIEKKYPANDYKEVDAPLEDMSLEIETDEISILLVFNNINIFNDVKQERKDYYVDLNSIFIK